MRSFRRFELSGLFIGGKETSAISLSWILALLPQRPDLERRLVEELDGVLGGREPRASDLPELRYLHTVLEENLRVHPPVWLLFPRKTTDDVSLGGHLVQRYRVEWAGDRPVEPRVVFNTCFPRRRAHPACAAQVTTSTPLSEDRPQVSITLGMPDTLRTPLLLWRT